MKIYGLYEYGISLKIIKKLVKKNITLKDINKNIANKFSCPELVKMSKKYLKEHDSEFYSLACLFHFGLTERQFKVLEQRKIDMDYLKDSNVESLINKKIAKNTANKIISVYEDFCHEVNKNTNTNFEKNPKENETDSSMQLLAILETICSDKPASAVVIKTRILQNFEYSISKFDKDIIKLENEKKIVRGDSGIMMNYPNLKAVISNLENNEIVFQIISGKTIEYVANKFNVSEEKVNEILKNELNEIPRIREDKYKSSFEKYKWTQDQFTKYYDEPESVFNYLNERYESGTINLAELLKGENLSKNEKDRLYNVCGYIEFLGNYIEPNTSEILRVILERQAKKEIKLDKLVSITNKYIDKYQPNLSIGEFDINTIVKISQKYNFSLIGRKNHIRYFDISKINEKYKNKLIGLLDIESGYYSTLIFYKENTDFMDEIGIYNEYELHSLLHHLLEDSNQNFKFKRSPIILVGIDNKRSFFDSIIAKLSPISVDDFVNLLYLEFGLKKNTTNSYLHKYYSNKINDGIIYQKQRNLKKEELAKLKTLLTEDIYTNEQFDKILFDLGYQNVEKVFNNHNISKIGYKRNSAYLISNKFSDLDEYMEYLIENNDYIDFNTQSYYRTSGFSSAIKNYESNLDLIEISENKYITSKKLKVMGISLESLKSSREKAVEILENNKYQSVNNLKKCFSTEILRDCAFDNIFYESIISSIDGIRVLRIDNNKLFTLTTDEISINNFISEICIKTNSVNSENISHTIFSTYLININADKVDEYLSRINNEIIDAAYN